MKLDAIGITSKNLTKTVEFYKLLGFEFPEFNSIEEHLEAKTAPGATRLMIDSVGMIKSILGEDPKPSNHSHFAIQYDSTTEVDDIIQSIRKAGFSIVKEPWQAVWGQYYAIVQDPDGYLVDLYANIQ